MYKSADFKSYLCMGSAGWEKNWPGWFLLASRKRPRRKRVKRNGKDQVKLTCIDIYALAG